MPYKVIPTKVCSECGQVLDTRIDYYCDGCNIKLNEKDYEKHIRLGFLMHDTEELKEDMTFHNLDCFIANVDKVDLEGVQVVSIEYIDPKLFREIVKSFKA